MDLSIIIVTWNSSREIGDCLRSVFAQEGVSPEVFVIDNASTDTTREVVKGLQLPLRTVWNDTNRGFSAAVNQGIAQATGEHLLLLNPDTELAPGALSAMRSYLRAHPEVGVAGGTVVNADGSVQPSVRRFPTVRDQSVVLLKLHRFFPGLISRYLAADVDYANEQDVDQVRGAFFFISRRALERVGALDERNFFIWFEEVDFCKRVKDAGMRVVYVPGPVCRHAGGVSFAQALSVQKQRWMNASMRNYFRKHGTPFDRAVIAVLAPVSLALAAIAGLIPRRFKPYV